jgi:hypothetical protein
MIVVVCKAIMLNLSAHTHKHIREVVMFDNEFSCTASSTRDSRNINWPICDLESSGIGRNTEATARFRCTYVHQNTCRLTESGRPMQMYLLHGSSPAPAALGGTKPKKVYKKPVLQFKTGTCVARNIRY